MQDPYRVLPHRDVRWMLLSAERNVYEHKPCGLRLTEADVKDANWCPHCAATINKAARKRAFADRSNP